MIRFNAKFPLSRLRYAQAPSPTRGEGVLRHLLYFILSICVFIPSAHAGAVPSPEYAQVRVVPSVTIIAPGDDFTVYIDQEITPDWHTYWKNPGDSGMPTTATWQLPDGVTVIDLEYPTPARIPFGPLTNFGYTDRAVFTQTITVPRDFSGDTLTATAKIEWLVCHDICIPEQTSATITVPVAKTSTLNLDAAELADIVSKTHPRRVEFDATFSEQEGKFEIFATSNHPDFIYTSDAKLDFSKAVFFPTEWGLIDNTASQTMEYDGSEDLKHLPFVLSTKRGGRALDAVKEFRVVLAIPDDQGVVHGFDMPVRGESLGHQSEVGQVPPEASPGSTFNSESSLDPDFRRGGTALDGGVALDGNTALFWPSILGAFLAGLILNLMPCVLPVLFIKIFAVAKLSGTERAHARAHGIMYAVGVIATFLTLAGILVALQSAGASVGWGFQLQSPLVVAALTALFMGLTLNLLGVFDIDFTRFIPTFLQRVEDKSHWNSFLTGILAVFVATPCTVPFMGAAVVYGLTQGPVMTVAVFTAMGMGLSAPFVLLTFVPAFMRVIPKPGAWMIIFRRVCAVPMALTALWLGTVLWVQVMPPQARATITAPAGQTGAPIPYTPDVLKQALATDKSVLVNMTAAWCITCKYNERMALDTPATRELIVQNKLIYIVGDWTRYDADITAYLNEFGRKGVPLYVFYPGGTPRGKPIVLPQLLDKDILQRLSEKD